MSYCDDCGLSSCYECGGAGCSRRVRRIPVIDPHAAEVAALRREIANLREIVANEAPPPNVNAAYMEAHEGPGECVICGCEPGQRHVYLSHYAEGCRQ